MNGEFIKSIVLFNLDEIISSNAKKLIEFIFQYNISNKQDIYSLFCFYNLSDILDVYKNNKGIIVFYMSLKCQSWLLEEDGIIKGMNFNKFIKLITKRIQFPIIISNLSFKGFQNILKENSPEYDELITNYKFLSTIYDDIADVIKKLKFYSIEDKLLKPVNEKIKLISTF